MVFASCMSLFGSADLQRIDSNAPSAAAILSTCSAFTTATTTSTGRTAPFVSCHQTAATQRRSTQLSNERLRRRDLLGGLIQEYEAA
jgi:hypothetical protein